MAQEPLRNYQFSLQVRDKEFGAFTACTDLNMRIEPIMYREGGARQAVRWLASDVRHGEVCLRFGVTDTRDLWDWITAMGSGQNDRRNASIIMYTPTGDERHRYNLPSAWPCEWAGAHLDSLDQQVAFEFVKLV